ncbi:hypothetical protein OEZ86_009669 [Tetradesmus obliquus]|uniref:KOW domain-containing protein n=1 Tax=Tetradesmus obliquus TaxID=3088 RepID=A0ABY8UMM3_TETOB|nr:hypothetical protein OEZ85_001113 [Tetradesmus obliquus]WIA43157.1 hypothetical protein OEZ86_009669 [Tetradesmus obliquus]
MPSKPLKAIQPMFQSASSWKIVRGDKVQVMAGRDKGKQGEVLKVIRDERFPRLFVSGVNMVTRHIRGDVDPDSGEKVPGYTVKYEHPIHYSNVMLLDPEKNTPVRVTMKYEDQPPFRKVRMTRGKKASGCIVPWPEAWKKDPYPSTDEGAKDTKPEEAAKVTYNPAADFTMQNMEQHAPQEAWHAEGGKELAGPAVRRASQRRSFPEPSAN